jgi:hypothetical protein
MNLNEEMKSYASMVDEGIFDAFSSNPEKKYASASNDIVIKLDAGVSAMVAYTLVSEYDFIPEKESNRFTYLRNRKDKSSKVVIYDGKPDESICLVKIFGKDAKVIAKMLMNKFTLFHAKEGEN